MRRTRREKEGRESACDSTEEMDENAVDPVCEVGVVETEMSQSEREQEPAPATEAAGTRMLL